MSYGLIERNWTDTHTHTQAKQLMDER